MSDLASWIPTDQPGLFDEPPRVDWDALSGVATTVHMSWGDVPCIIRGTGVGGFAGILVELLDKDGEHAHEGACRTIPVSSITVAVPANPPMKRV